jgi:hypothetical protein
VDRRRRTLLLALVAASATAHAQPIEIIDLRHRTADDVLPLLRPLVESGGALTGQGSQLFLRASPANVQQIRQLLAALDRRPRQLQITVRQDRASEQSAHTRAADGSVVIDSRRSRGSVTLEAGNSRSTAARSIDQSIRVIEGGRATITFGSAVPFTFRHYVATAQGLTAVDATTYVEAVTQFAVRPLLAGEEVTLELSPQDATITAQGIERMRLMTRVQGRLGEWIALGDADLREQAQRDGVLSADARATSTSRGAWVKVDEVTAGAQAPGSLAPPAR